MDSSCKPCKHEWVLFGENGIVVAPHREQNTISEQVRRRGDKTSMPWLASFSNVTPAEGPSLCPAGIRRLGLVDALRVVWGEAFPTKLGGSAVARERGSLSDQQRLAVTQ